MSDATPNEPRESALAAAHAKGEHESGRVDGCPSCNVVYGLSHLIEKAVADIKASVGKRVRYRSPNGLLLIGTAETVLVTQRIDGFELDEDGEPEPIWTRKRTVHWSSQQTRRSTRGPKLYVDEMGSEWILDDCTEEEEGA
jgi:hypothetical protein